MRPGVTRRLGAEFGVDAVDLFLQPASALRGVEADEVVGGDVGLDRQTVVRKSVIDRRNHDVVAGARWIEESRVGQAACFV